MNSFSATIKKELSELNNLANKDLVKAELKGYLSTFNGKEFSTESEYNINRYGKLLSNVDINDYKIEIKGNVYQIKTKERPNKINEIILANEEQKKSFIRGAFLASGYVNDPQNVYHLEIVLEEESKAKELKQIISEFNINVKYILRENKCVLYVKDGDSIVNLLALIGASKSVLKFEDTRVVKDIRNNVNRIVNCETANLNKTINASVKQIGDIKYIKEKRMFNKLNEKEQNLANLRLKNPNATLTELGNMSEPVLSKSGVKHRMEKITNFAEELRKGNKDE